MRKTFTRLSQGAKARLLKPSHTGEMSPRGYRQTKFGLIEGSNFKLTKSQRKAQGLTRKIMDMSPEDRKAALLAGPKRHMHMDVGLVHG